MPTALTCAINAPTVQLTLALLQTAPDVQMVFASGPLSVVIKFSRVKLAFHLHRVTGNWPCLGNDDIAVFYFPPVRVAKVGHDREQLFDLSEKLAGRHDRRRLLNLCERDRFPRLELRLEYIFQDCVEDPAESYSVISVK